MFDPQIEVEHHHESTIGKYFKQKKIERISYRNQFIFIWKNAGTPMLIEHMLRLPIFLLITIVNPAVTLGFVAAVLRLPVIMQKRGRQKRFYKRRDREILELFRV